MKKSSTKKCTIFASLSNIEYNTQSQTKSPQTVFVHFKMGSDQISGRVRFS